MRKLVFQIIITAALLFYIAHKVDWAAIGGTLAGISVFYFITSTLAAIAGTYCMAVKYHVLIKNSTLELSLTRLMVINIISRFYALFLPSALGPEAVRWLKVTRNKTGKSFFLASTIVERLFFLLVLLACGAIPLLFSATPSLQLLSRRLQPLLAMCFFGLTIALLFFLIPSVNEPARRFLLRTLRLSQDSRLHHFIGNFSLKNSSSHVMVTLLLQTLIWQFLFLIRMYLLFLALDLPFDFWDSTWINSLVLLLQILPVTYAGLGLREGAYAYLFKLQGVPPELGVSIGLLFFTQFLIFAALGWLFETMDVLKSKRK